LGKSNFLVRVRDAAFVKAANASVRQNREAGVSAGALGYKIRDIGQDCASSSLMRTVMFSRRVLAGFENRIWPVCFRPGQLYRQMLA